MQKKIITDKNNVGIFGFGEVGQAIAKFYKNPRIKDLNCDDGFEGIEILNVCIPWSDKFLDLVEEQIKKFDPKLIIIHSTTMVGTVKKLSNKFFGKVVHSPIRGVHPNLYEGVKTFVKYIGADDEFSGKLAQSHLESLGIKTKLFSPSTTTEALKIWDTTQYGWQIVLNKEIKKWCDKTGIDFEVIYTEANKSYNEGYHKLGRPEVLRPYLKYIDGEIGGHCVIPNCNILDSDISKFILQKNEEYKKHE